MSKRILDYDPLTGITTYFDYNHEERAGHIYREQTGVDVILDANKALQNDDDVTKKGIKDGWWHYGQIPMIVLEKWMNEHGVDAFKKENWEKNGPVWKLLNHPDYRWIKTTSKMHWG